MVPGCFASLAFTPVPSQERFKTHGSACFRVVRALSAAALRFAQRACRARPKPAPSCPAPLPPHADRLITSAPRTPYLRRRKEEEDYPRMDHGNRAAFDIDLCKAVAVALLGPGARLLKSFPDEPFAVPCCSSPAGGHSSRLPACRPANMASGTWPFLRRCCSMARAYCFPTIRPVHCAADLAGKMVCFLTGLRCRRRTAPLRRGARHLLRLVPVLRGRRDGSCLLHRQLRRRHQRPDPLANIRGIDERRAAEFTILPQTCAKTRSRWLHGPAIRGLRRSLFGPSRRCSMPRTSRSLKQTSEPLRTASAPRYSSSSGSPTG